MLKIVRSSLRYTIISFFLSWITSFWGAEGRASTQDVLRISPVHAFQYQGRDSLSGPTTKEINTGTSINFIIENLYSTNPSQVRVTGFSLSVNSFGASQWKTPIGSPPALDGRVVTEVSILTSTSQQQFFEENFRVLRIKLDVEAMKSVSYDKKGKSDSSRVSTWPNRPYQIDIFVSKTGGLAAKVYWLLESASKDGKTQVHTTVADAALLSLYSRSESLGHHDLAQSALPQARKIFSDEIRALTTYIPGVGELIPGVELIFDEAELIHTVQGNLQSVEIANRVIQMRYIRKDFSPGERLYNQRLAKVKSEIETLLEQFQVSKYMGAPQENLLKEIVGDLVWSLSTPGFSDAPKVVSQLFEFYKSLEKWRGQTGSRLSKNEMKDFQNLDSAEFARRLNQLAFLSRIFEDVVRVALSSEPELRILRQIQKQGSPSASGPNPNQKPGLSCRIFK